ncbi:hypothetical protein KEM56_001623, partial [Ascosphaera pollenicola]
ASWHARGSLVSSTAQLSTSRPCGCTASSVVSVVRSATGYRVSRIDRWPCLPTERRHCWQSAPGKQRETARLLLLLL